MNIFLSVLVCSLSFLLTAQPSATNFQSLKVDKMGNLYIVKGNNYELIKLDKEGTPIHEYSENSFGQITSIDVINPFQLLVFYEDYAVIHVLDRTLSLIHEIDLIESGVEQPGGVCLADDNTIWVFDRISNSLKQLDNFGLLLAETADLSLETGMLTNIQYLSFYDNRLWVHLPERGLYTFDRFGNYLKQIHLPNVDKYQHTEGGLWFSNEEGLFFYDFKYFEVSRLNLNQSYLSSGVWAITKDGVWALFEQNLQFFSEKTFRKTKK